MFTLLAIVSNLYHKIRHDGEEWLLDSFILSLVLYVVLKISH